MRQFPASPSWVLGSLWTHRSLIWQMTRREVIGRYRGSIMGILWSFFFPILMLAVYTFFFGVILQSRWGQGEASKADFAIMVFAGMIIHGLFGECFNRAPQLILGNVSYVKKVVFPLEVLPWVSMGSALFHAAISTAVLLLFILLVHGQVPSTLFLFPIVVLPLILFTMGIAWFLTSTGVYVRDIVQITGVVTMVLLFLSPVFFPISALPEEYRPLFYLNPLTPAIEQARDVLVRGELPDWGAWVLYLVGGAAVAWFGLAWFQKTRRGFADVL